VDILLGVLVELFEVFAEQFAGIVAAPGFLNYDGDLVQDSQFLRLVQRKVGGGGQEKGRGGRGLRRD
jgi:hypothetical protein